MLKKFIITTALASMALTVPQSASADAKDVAIGAAIGALLNNAVRNDQAKRQQQQRQTQTKRVVKSAPATLNSTYTRTERRQIQASLNALGYPVGTVDGVLGRKSRGAISQFQASRGEPATGQLTRTQFVALTSPALTQQPVMANRMLNPQEVAMLQQSLFQLGFYRGTFDGVNGPGTQQAMMNYLATQGRSPANTSRVLATAMAMQAAGFQVPPYLMQEAQASMVPAQPFGAQPAQPFGTQQAFGAQPQQAFGAQPQQQFGAQPQQAFGTQPQQQFGAQPQQTFGAQPQQPQQQFGTQPQQPAGTLASVPQGGQQGLFAAPAGTAPQQQLGAQGGQVLQPGIQQQPQTVPQTAQQPLFGTQPAQQQPLQQQPQQQVPVQQGGQTTTLFAAGSGVAPAVQAPAQQQSGLDIFSPTQGGGEAVAQQQTDGLLPQTGQAAFVSTD